MPRIDKTSRRYQIIKTAASLFATNGYYSTSLDEIARAVGIKKPSLYYHIDSKQQILREIVRGIIEPLEEITTLSKSSLSPREKIKYIINTFVELHTERKECTAIYLNELKFLDRKSRNAIQQREKKVEQILQQILMEGANDESFRIGDVKTASYAILGACHWIYRWYESDDSLTPSQIAEELLKLFESGYLCHSKDNR